MDNIQEQFIELHEIYQEINRDIDSFCELKIQQVIFYINLTYSLQNEIDLQGTTQLEDNLRGLSKNNFLNSRLGSLFEYTYIDTQSIFIYYLKPNIQDNRQKQILKLRVYIQELICQSKKQIEIKFVFLLAHNQIDLDIKQNDMIEYIQQLLQGFHEINNNTICFFQNLEDNEINYFTINSKRIKLIDPQITGVNQLNFILKLHKDFKYSKIDFQTLSCPQYIQNKADVVLKEFEQYLYNLQNSISQLVQFPIDLENRHNQNVNDFLNQTKFIIENINNQLITQPELKSLIIKIPQILKGKEKSIKEVLNELVKQIRQFEIYLKIGWRGKLPQQIFDELIQLEFKIFDSDFEIFKKLKKFKYHDFVLIKAANNLLIKTNQLLKQFDSQIPQSFGVLKRIMNQPNDVQPEKSYIILLGGTKVGKSTLLNILSDPKNVVLNNDKFDVKQKDERILISDTLNSETYQISHINIDDEFVFVDTPGISDTYQYFRMINDYNIYKEITSRLNNNQKFLFLILIDAQELQQQKKNQFIELITQLKLIFNYQIQVNSLKDLIIPVFARIQDENTIKNIYDIWESDIMKGITDQFVINVCNFIKDLLQDQSRYLILENGKNYQVNYQTLLLEITIYNLHINFRELSNAKKFQECEKVNHLITEKEKEREKTKQIDFENKMIRIKNDFLQKCRKVLENQQINRIDFVQKFQLNNALVDQVKSVLNICKKFYQQCLINITNEFTIKILFDKEERFKYLIKFQLEDTSKMKELSDLPKEIINEQLQKQIEVINEFVEFLNPENNQIQNYKQVNFDYFNVEFKILKNCFNQDQYTYNQLTELRKQGWKNLNEEKVLPKWLFRILAFSCIQLIQIPYLLVTKVMQTNSEIHTQNEEQQNEILGIYYYLKSEQEI